MQNHSTVTYSNFLAMSQSSNNLQVQADKSLLPIVFLFLLYCNKCRLSDSCKSVLQTHIIPIHLIILRLDRNVSIGTIKNNKILGLFRNKIPSSLLHYWDSLVFTSLPQSYPTLIINELYLYGTKMFPQFE